MRNQYKRYFFQFAFLVALLLSMSGIGVPFAQGHVRLASSQKVASQTCGTWSIVPSPNGDQYYNFLLGVSALSSSDVWAVGYYESASDLQSRTLIEHWNGTSWTQVTSPGSNDSLLLGVAALSTGDVWAVGYSGGSTLIEFYC